MDTPPGDLINPDADYNEHFEKVERYVANEPRAADVAANWLAAPDDATQAVAIDVLGWLARAEHARPVARRHLLDACQRVVSSASQNVRWSVAHALNALGTSLNVADAEAAELLAELARDGDSDVRWQVAAGLGGLAAGHEAPAAVVDALMHLARDEDPEVRSRATFGLATQLTNDSAEIRTALVELASNSDDEVAGEAVAGLAWRKDPAGRAFLRARLRSPTVGNVLVEAAMAYGDEEWVPLLEELARGGWKERDPIPSLLDQAIAVCMGGASGS